MAVGKRTCLAILSLAVVLSAGAALQKADFVELCVHGSVAEITAALKAGANVNLGNAHGVTPLMYAAGFNSLAAVKLLIRAKADVKAKDNKGWTALNLAVEYEKNTEFLEIVKTLLAAGADVNAETDEGYTPLMQAAEFTENLEIIHVLLLAGADPKISNLEGLTALDLAEDNPALFGTDALDELRKAMKTGVIPQAKTVDPLPETKAPAKTQAPAAVNPGGALVGQWSTRGEKDELSLVFMADGTYTSAYRTSTGVQNDQGNYQLTGDTLTLKMLEASVGAKLTWINADTIGLVLEAGPQYRLYRVK